jgi:glycosyltransferase involved in cell wall biosynthesis
MSKIKILHIHTLPVVSGSGIHTLITMQGLKDKGYIVEFACAPGGALVDEAIKSNIPFRPIRHFVQEINIFKDLMALFELVSLMRKRRYTIIHSHNSKAGFLGRLAANIAAIPIIVHTIHGFAFHEYEKPPRRILFILLERIAAKFADKLITVSTPLKVWGLRLRIGIEQKYAVIPDGIEMERFNIKIDLVKKKQELGINPQDLVVGMVAKLWEGKGYHTLIDAALEIIQEVPNVKFLFVGEGYLRRELEKIVLAKGLKEYIIFTGFRKDIPQVSAIFDVAVLASFFEGLGRSLLEAMVLGKPVVASNVGGIPEVVKHGVNGFLVPAGNHYLLAEAIIRLLRDESLRKRMGQEGRKMIDERFLAEKMVGDIIGVYEELLENKGLGK